MLVLSQGAKGKLPRLTAQGPQTRRLQPYIIDAGLRAGADQHMRYIQRLTITIGQRYRGADPLRPGLNSLHYSAIDNPHALFGETLQHNAGRLNIASG